MIDREKLVEYRKRKGMTQVNLAKKAKVNQATISSIETGRGEPSLKLIVTLANVLDVSVDDLLIGN